MSSYSKASSYTFRTNSTHALRGPNGHVPRTSSGMLREFLWRSSAYQEESGHTLELDPEAMTKQERLSRMLHVPSENRALPTSGPLFEHFIVVGLPHANAHKPELLFSYPPSNPVTIPGLAHFCFPSGVVPQKLKKTKSNSNLLQVLYSQSYHQEPENAYVFLLTTAEGEHLYGVCVIKHENVLSKPSFIPRDSSQAGEPAPDELDVVAPRCYCLVTRLPFLKLHFETLYSVLDLEYMASISDLQTAPNAGGTNTFRAPRLSHSYSLPALPVSSSLVLSSSAASTPALEKRKKKIRLRGRLTGTDASSAQDQSPFPGIPLHTVYKMPVSGDHQPPPQQLATSFSSSSSSSSFSSSSSLVNAAPEPRGDPIDAAVLLSAVAAHQEDATKLSEDTLLTGAELNRVSDATTAGGQQLAMLPLSDTGSCQSMADRRGRSASGVGTDEGISPRKGSSEWKRSALEGRGIINTRYGSAGGREADTAGNSTEEAESGQPERKQNLVIKILHDYLTLGIPKPNHTVTFFVHKSLQPLRFHRPAFQDKEHLLSDYCLPVTFHLLSTDNILTYITACLLEKRVVVHSSNIRFLSSAVLAIMPLLRPFEYHSVHIPIVPDMMQVDLLEAPMPFVLGFTSPPPKAGYPKDKDMKEFVIVDLDNDKVTAKEALVQLPQYKELRKKLKPLHKVVSSGQPNGKVPLAATEEQTSCCHGVALILQTYFTSLFANFRAYCLCDKTDSEKPITVFLKESFLNDQPRASRPFLSRFLETRPFLQYCDQRLRQLDAPPTTHPTF